MQAWRVAYSFATELPHLVPVQGNIRQYADPPFLLHKSLPQDARTGTCVGFAEYWTSRTHGITNRLRHARAILVYHHRLTPMCIDYRLLAGVAGNMSHQQLQASS
jgi:hypothetical protein